ncbi:MAG: NTP transferase domain-containing protein [Alphaproteobacteria bacterium]|nr:NTP transferase domain-containing protein [Alphaproteobacteria bacterium]
MIFAALPLDDCAGALLAHSQVIGGRRVAKGTPLDAATLAAARADGLTALTVARLEPGDIPEAEAAVRLGKALAGAAVEALPPVNGRVNLAARAAGLLRLDPAAVDALNAVDEALTLGTLAPFARVAAGDIVATIKIIPYAVPVTALDAALAAAASARLTIAAFRPAAVTLIQTRLPGQGDKLFAKTESVTRARLAALGSTLDASEICAHEPGALAARLRAAGPGPVLVAGASATVDRRDVVPAAIVAAGGAVLRLGMPVDPGNLLCLGELGGRPVLGLPGCARSPKRNGVDLVLERLLAGLDAGPAEIAAMGVGGLLAETAERGAPREASKPARGPVGAVVLAAGRSTRMGGVTKLVADLDGKPVLAHVLDAIAAAELPPIAVLGDRAELVRAAAGDRDVTFVTAPDYAEGLSRSLRAGLAAVPADWRGVLVCLGDMPRVDAALLSALVTAADGDSAIVVPTSGGKRGNPVLWGRAHLPRLMTLDGDVGGKQLLGELADHVVEVEVGGDAIFADVDTPEALAALRRE